MNSFLCKSCHKNSERPRDDDNEQPRDDDDEQPRDDDDEQPHETQSVCHQVCCPVHRKAFDKSNYIISPFDVKDWSVEVLCFFFHYAIVLILFFGVLISAAVYIAHTYVPNGHDPRCVKNAVDITRIVLQLVGLFCAIQSCFIFSKIVYCITEKLDKLKGTMNETAEQGGRNRPQVGNEQQQTQPAGNEQEQATLLSALKTTNTMLTDLKNKEHANMECYYKLQEDDQNFIDGVKPTLDLYGVWFIFHWIFYSLTSLLHSAVIIELLLDVVSYRVSLTDEYVPSTKAEIEAPYIFYIVFFTLLHAYLFLYPCFRAAAIDNARQELINNIAKKKDVEWKRIPLSVRSNFVEYLKLQDFGFKVSICCADIPCGLGLAFVSLFIAVCGGFIH